MKSPQPAPGIQRLPAAVRSMTLLSALLLAAAHLQGHAEETAQQPHHDIEAAAADFIRAELGAEYPSHRIKVGPLDPRLRLRLCDRPLQGFLPPGGRLPGNTTIGVRCAGQTPWTLYVPGAVKVSAEVVVVKHMVMRGAPIRSEDIGMELRELNSTTDLVRDPAQVVGKLARRTLAADLVLAPSMLAAPLLVRRGQQVVLVATIPGIDVRGQGIALGDGGVGDRIQVRNPLSKRIVEATVIEAGVAQVSL